MAELQDTHMIIVLHHQNCLTTCPNAHAVLYSNHNSVLLQCKVINTSGIQESVEYMYVFFYILVRAQFYHAMSHIVHAFFMHYLLPTNPE